MGDFIIPGRLMDFLLFLQAVHLRSEDVRNAA